MYHRYGRHGPHAWKRRRQRLFERRLPAVVSTVAIVRVHVPIHVERIIIIMLKSEGEERNEIELRAVEPITDGTIIHPFAQEDQNFIQEMRIVAHDEGLNRAQADILRFDMSIESYPTTERLFEEAKGIGVKYIQQNHPLARGDTAKQIQLGEIYARAYVAGYQEWLLASRRIGNLLSEEELSIRQQARADRTSFQNTLSSECVVYLGVIRALEYYHYKQGAEVTMAVLSQIGNYVDVYERTYNEKERL